MLLYSSHKESYFGQTSCHTRSSDQCLLIHMKHEALFVTKMEKSDKFQYPRLTDRMLPKFPAVDILDKKFMFLHWTK